MGINDREYVRQPPVQRAGARPPMRMLSVTGWIIAACVAVFVLNVFVPPVSVVMRTELLPDANARQIEGIRASEFKYSQDFWGIEPSTLQPLPMNAPGAATVGVRFVLLGDKEVAKQWLSKQSLFVAWGSFCTAKAVVWHDPIVGWSGLQVWRFITFQFLHADQNHILFNMIALFFFGGMVESYLGRKRFLAFYLLCGACGALMYLILNGLGLAGMALFGERWEVPGLLFGNPMTPLMGASAGVFGVLMAGAFLAPNAEVLLFFVIPMRLRTLAYGLLCLALLTVFFGWTNAGGEAAHIGGALAGFYFIRNPHHLHGMFDFMGQFDPTSRTARARRTARASGPAGSEVDRILAKIREHGLVSLSEDEKRTLREASRR